MTTGRICSVTALLHVQVPYTQIIRRYSSKATLRSLTSTHTKEVWTKANLPQAMFSTLLHRTRRFVAAELKGDVSAIHEYVHVLPFNFVPQRQHFELFETPVLCAGLAIKWSLGLHSGTASPQRTDMASA